MSVDVYSILSTMRATHPLVLSAFATLFFSAPLPAQLVGGQWDTLHQFAGGAASQQHGFSVSDTGDVDGDGFADFIVGAPGIGLGPVFFPGSAYVYSGATGVLIWQFNGATAVDNLGSSVSGAGDVDGDGFADIIVGAPQAKPGGLWSAGSAYVYSGATGGLIWQFDGAAADDLLGMSVSDAGDVDGDGFDDLFIGAPGADPGGLNGAGSAYVYSGATGGLIWQFDGAATWNEFGWAVSGTGDVDGDGFDDLISGSTQASPSGLGAAGSAYVYSGATGGLIWQFDGTASGDWLGASLSDAGDVDGDGFDDLIVGARNADPGGLSKAGSAYVYSGATGGLIWQFNGVAANEKLGWSVSGAGDVDGDAFADLIVGAIGANSVGSAFVYSGASGSLIRQFDGTAANFNLGWSVSGAGDVDGDGLAEIIVGDEGAAPGGVSVAGSAYVYSLDPYLHPSAGELSVSGGSTVQLGMDFPASEAGARYAVLASITGTGPIVMGGLEIPLTQDNVFNLITSGNVPAPLQGAFGTLNANGQALATLSSGPALAPAIGQTVYFAAVTYDVGPLTGRMSSVVRYLQITP